MNDNQPGQLISPQGSEDPQPTVPGTPSPDRPTEVTPPTPAPTPPPEQLTPAQPTVPQPPAAPVPPVAPAVPASNWEFSHAEEEEFMAQSAVGQHEWGDISWTAAEFVEHQKSASWYLTLSLVGAVVAALAYLISRDKITTGVIVLVMIGFGLIAARRPREQQYRLTPQGVQIGNHAYDFQDFRTFSVTEDGSVVSIVFMPLKRFMPALTIYVAPNLEEQVVQFLSAFLPFERHRADAVDSLMRRIRF